MGKGTRSRVARDEEPMSFDLESRRDDSRHDDSRRDDSTKTVVQPTKFFGEPGEDIEKWLKSFDRISKANNWPEKRQRDILPAFLRERAAEFYDELEGDLSLEDLKKEMTKHFLPKEARRFYYADLYARKQGNMESSDDFGREIQQLLRRAYADMPVEHQDTLMREHFVNGLRPEIKRIVLIADPKTFLKAMELAKREEINEQITNGTAPWVRPNNVANSQASATSVSVAAISGEQKINDRLDRLEGVLEKLAISMANMQAPRPEQRRQWRGENRDRNLRCSDGRPICNFCKRVGHVEAKCRDKMNLNGQENSKN